MGRVFPNRRLVALTACTARECVAFTRQMGSKRRVCVVGAGITGLCALRHALAQGLEAVAYEQCSEIGGTWICMEPAEGQSEEDVHSSMYEGLRTNLPKEVMGYPDFDYSDDIAESFISAKEVLAYLQTYAAHFKLAPHIKLQHQIVRVRPRNGTWEVIVHNVPHNQYSTEYFDFVLVCNGHYTTPRYPNLEGMDTFRGEQLHSHLYRKPEIFKGHTVLIVGAGPSGIDIASHAYQHAEQVYLSHHLENAPDISFMPNAMHKPDVASFTETEAHFKDGSRAAVTFVVYCTGYKYTFPFLSVDCGLNVDENYVQPLYKHCLNINQPTMAFIGLPLKVLAASVSDLQVRFVLKFFTQQCSLPSREAMLADMERDMNERWASGLSKRVAHQMGRKQFDYYDELAELAGTTKLKPVIGNMLKECTKEYIYELATYRDNNFKVIDDENFVRTASKQC